MAHSQGLKMESKAKSDFLINKRVVKVNKI